MFQKWSLLKCTSCFLVLSLSTLCFAQPKRLPTLLQAIERKYTKSLTLSANFSQKNINAAFSREKISSGKIYFKHPSKFRWETFSPDPNIMVSDGKKLWFYTPPFDADERGQVIEKPASAIQSKLANALLSGSFSMARALSILQLNSTTFQLAPFPGTADTVQKATLIVDPTQKLITKIILEHKGGNRSEISLTQIIIGPNLTDSLFILIPPPNTDKLTD